MFRGRLSLVIALIFSFSSTTISAGHQNQQTPTPDNKPRKIKREDDRVFRDWANSDVKLIITPEEEDAYNKLKTNEERENFINIFWQRRDPSPDTEENEYKDEYYERIAYANEHFGSGKSGWLTDRGRIYVKWGKPTSVESHPAGGQYQQTNYDGGTSATYAFEKWFYRYLPGVGSGIEVEFVDPSGSGEYRLAHNPFEKVVPLNGPVEGATGYGDPNSNRRSESPFEVIELMNKLEGTPPVSPPTAVGSTHQPVEDENQLNFEVRPYYFFQADGNAIAAFTIQTENRALSFQNSGGLQTARVNVFGKVFAVTNRKVGTFEQTLMTTATTEELSEAKQRQSAYGRAMILPPGKYRIDVMLRDVNSGATGLRQLAFTVPRLDSTKLQTSSLVLAAKVESRKDETGVSQFTIGRTKVVPNISGEYHRGEPVGIYLQVYNAGIDQTTLRPAVDVEYRLLKDGKEIRKQAEDWIGMSEAGPRLTLARLLDSSQLTAGQYELQIDIRDHVSGQTLTRSGAFSIIK
jgi:GWxTD domain-containing protein